MVGLVQRFHVLLHQHLSRVFAMQLCLHLRDKLLLLVLLVQFVRFLSLLVPVRLDLLIKLRNLNVAINFWNLQLFCVGLFILHLIL